MKQLLLIVSLLIAAPSIFAANFYCPNTYRYINTGTTPAQVISACGEPAKKASRQEAVRTNVPLEQWFYHFSSHASADSIIHSVVTLKNGRISAITLAGQSVQSLSFCAEGSPVGVGDTEVHLQSLCGEPALKNQSSTSQVSGRQQVTEWLYNFGPYHPKAVFKFVNGRLAEINSQ